MATRTKSLTTTVYLYRYKPEYMDTPILVAAGYESANADYILVDKRELTVEVQDDSYYVPEQVRMLRNAKDKIYADAAQEVAEIDDKIAKLLCLEAPAEPTDEPLATVWKVRSPDSNLNPSADIEDDGLPF
jgi:hypothetical protein